MIRKDVIVEINNKLVSGSVLFHTLDSKRLVSPKFTGAIVLLIKQYLNNRPKIIFDYNLLIPENIGVISKREMYSQFLVDKNYRLLKLGKLLSYEEALFILLGLNTEVLQRESPFKDIKLFNVKPETDSLENIFCSTLQHDELSRSVSIKNGSIASDDLILIALYNNFFKTEDERITSRTLDENTTIRLYLALQETGYIDGAIDEMWKWTTNRNKLASLARQLKQLRLIGKDCHSILANYIEDPNPTAKKSLSNLPDTDISHKSEKEVQKIAEKVASKDRIETLFQKNKKWTEKKD